MAGRLFTSESVTEGHPDKIADKISDTVLDYLMEHDSDKENLRTAIETLLTTGLVVVAGEVRTSAYAPVAELVRAAILEIGYDSSLKGFDGASCGVQVAIGGQSVDIAQGVDDGHESRVGSSEDDLDKRGAGDQTACRPQFLTFPIGLLEYRQDATLRQPAGTTSPQTPSGWRRRSTMPRSRRNSSSLRVQVSWSSNGFHSLAVGPETGQASTLT